MVSPKKFVLAIGLIVMAWGILPQAVFATSNAAVATSNAAPVSKSDYFDFGPYYGLPQVLGFSFSSLENLPPPVLPDNLVLPKAGGILTDSPFYFFDRAAENVRLTFTFDPVKREELRLGFAQERLVEAKTLMDQGKTEAASSALDGYNQAFQDTTKALSALAARGDPGAGVLAAKIDETASAQAVIARNLALTSAPVQAQQWNSVTKAAQEILDQAAEVKGDPAIPEDLSTGIQKLKEQGLVSEEESNKLYGLKSRGEVREELDKLVSSGQFPGSELIKLDTAIAENYPDVQKETTANFQVAELRTYQTLAQPSEKVLDEITKWQGNPSISPPNDIKPYMWYSRALDLAKEVDLTGFSPDQQQEVGKLYPKAVADNPTYVPLPSPSPPAGGPSPSPAPASDANQTPSPTPAATPTATAVNPYLGGTSGALPGQPTYFIKRWGENLQTSFTFDPVEKARLKLQQAERRLNEAAAISTDSKKGTEYENSIKSYSRAMADASSYLKNSKNNEKAQDAAGQLEGVAARHEAMLEKGLLPAPKDPKLIAEAIKVAEDALDRSADVQNRPALPPALADRLGDLKAQGLILAEEADDLVRSNSREEVREKIRKLVELGTFPPADSKKMDEAQILTSPSDYNQLVEVKKVEELQNLRTVQSEFAQTPTLKAAAANLAQKEVALVSSIDLSGIKQEDLGGRQDLVQTYQQLVATASARPINSGQFGVLPETPKASDAVLGTCPVGATFKSEEGCVWADSGKKINDYEQYKCEGYGQYYSFAVGKCVAYEPGKGFKDDAQPVCPAGYNWSWQTQSCQVFTGGRPYPTPSPEPEPKDEKEREDRSRSCPEGSSYKPPAGCVWDNNDRPVYDSGQYRCSRTQYYSFDQQKCVSGPKEGQSYPKDAVPNCKEAGSFWSWSEAKCLKTQEAQPVQIKDVVIPKPVFVTPDSPFYFLKKAGETVQLAVSFTPEARQNTRISQARERLAEGYAALEKGDEENFSQALTAYTAKMQDIYNDVSKSSLSEKAKKAIGERLTKEAVEQNLILQKIEVVATNEQVTVLSAASSSVILGIDKAADLAGKPPLPDELKAKVEALPAEMISEEDKKKLLEAGSRVEARLELGELAAKGGVTAADTVFLNEDFDAVDAGAKVKIGELKKLKEIVNTLDQRDKTLEKVEKNEAIAVKLADFQKSFEPGRDVPADIRQYVRLTRIDEVAQTIRPDIVRLEDFQNRKDLVLAVATLQEEFRPTRQAIEKVQAFRRANPGAGLPPELARIEALSFSLGIRNQAGPCYLPTPPFPANTPCPPPGAPIQVSGSGTQASDYFSSSSLTYGQGPKSESAGVCPNGYHWMYDSGGWCMSNSGSYGPSSPGSYTPSGPQTAGYTPYSPYYTAPGAPPFGGGGGGSYFPGGGNYSYSPPSYYGSAPTYYTTNPPAGTVPGSGPAPISPGQCPSGFHWMSDSGGWCMADGGTYAPSSGYSGYPGGTTTSSTPPPGGYNCGGQPYDPATQRCRDGACPGGFNWNGSACVTAPTGGGYSTSSSYQYGCTPGYYWDGSKCVAGSYEGSGWSDTTARTQSWCQPPSGGCGSNSYWDYGSCYCRSSSTYYGGSGPSPSNQCQGLSCGGGAWLDYSTCSCRYSGGSGTSSSGTPITCYPPSAGCPGGWYDYGTCSCKYSSSGTSSGGGSSYCSPPSGGCGSGWFDSASCSCKQASSQGCYNVSASSCGSGWYWDSSACTCRQSGSSTYTSPSSGGGSTSGGGSSSSGSCSSGYHWMSDNGGWCMQDGAGSSSGGSTPSSTPPPSTSTPPSGSEPTPTQSAPPASEPAPAPPSTEPPPPAPAPSP